MLRKLSVSILLIIQLLFSPILGLSVVWAIPQPPEIPTAPVAPSTPSIPEAPITPEAPNAPETPTAPSNPNVNTNNHQLTNPTQPETPTVNDIPAAPQAPVNNPAYKEKTKQQNQNSNDSSTSAIETTAQNNQTGADSNNSSEVDNNQTTDVNTDNDAKVINDLVLTSDSGGNQSDKNTGDTTINTGSATIQGLIENQANSTNTSVNNCGDCINGGSAGNTQTGAGSDNHADVNLNSETIVENNNNADLDTGIIAIADSGHNSADKNTGNVEIRTGDVNVGLTVVNVANTDITGVQTSEYDVYDDHSGDIVIGFNSTSNQTNNNQTAANTTTGADSVNQANVNNNTSLTLVNNNNATVASDLVIDAISGYNSADKNTGDVTIATGDANVVTNVVNLVNNTIQSGTEILVATVNIFGNLVGDIILDPLALCDGCGSGSQTASNSTTGANSENDSSVAQQRLNTVEQHNEANINNTVLVNANTGNNEVNQNTLGGTIETGQVNVQAEEVTVANNNLIASGEETWWIVIVNEAGKWVGKILGANEDDHVVVVDTIDLGAANNTTGADSSNQSNVNNSSNTEIVQNNQANVNNNIVINANTGGNSAEQNTGNANISTGDINIYQNVVNYVNNNIVGGKVVIAFVNVFGSWIGDVVTPGHEKQASASNTSNEQSGADPVNSNNESDNTAIGGPDTVLQLNSEGDASSNNPENNSTVNSNNDEEAQTVAQNDDAWQEWLASYQAKHQGSYGINNSTSKSRILAGTWLREEDPYLQTTPSPELEVQSTSISEGKSGWTNSDKNLVYLFLIVSPIGLVAARLKKRLLTN